MKLILPFVLALILISPGIVHGQIEKLYPVDQADQDPSFFSFRMHLMEAISKRDTAFIYSHLSPHIVNSFGGNGGIDEFKESWKPSSESSELWTVLGRITGGGGVYSDNTFSAPYYSANFPSDRYNPFHHGAVADKNVAIRVEPDDESKVLAKLSYDIVEVVDYYPHYNIDSSLPSGWVLIKLKDGQKGLIEKDYIGSALDYRARFEKTKGRWLITSLVAGD